jgi:hypothetical protein
MVDGRYPKFRDADLNLKVNTDGDRVVSVEVVGVTMPPKRCNAAFHVSYGNARSCYCGKRGNAAHRSWWQRYTDRRARTKRNRKAMLG